MVKCVECNDKKGIKRAKLEIVLCKECAKLEKYKLITKTEAKKRYLLLDDDLEGLLRISCNSSYGLATYFRYIDVKLLCCEKNGINEEDLESFLEEKECERNERIEERRRNGEEKRVRDRERREERLRRELGKCGLVLRDDSVLCRKYMDGLDIRLEEVVRRMCEMRYLYEYCHMEECKDIAYREYREELDAGFIPDMCVSDAAEHMALRLYSEGGYPEVFPWMS